MVSKYFIVAVAIIQAVVGQYLSGFGYRAAGFGAASASLGGASIGLGGASAGLGRASLGVGSGIGLSNRLGVSSGLGLSGRRIGTSSLTPSLTVASGGLAVASENAIEGNLLVTGQLPFLSAVAFEGALPTAGSGVTTCGCGGGKVGITSEGFGHRNIYY